MRIGIVFAVVILLGASFGAQAQTIYNAPGQSGSSATIAPLNLRELGRQQAAQQRQSAIPYSGSAATGQQSFAQRQAALNQWREQRDAQAAQAEIDSRNYLVALADASNALAFGQPSGQPAPPVTGAPPPARSGQAPVYRGARDNAPIQTPRRLFNTIE